MSGQTCLYNYALTKKEAPMGRVGYMLGHQVLNNYYALFKDSVIYYSQIHRITITVLVDTMFTVQFSIGQ